MALCVLFLLHSCPFPCAFESHFCEVTGAFPSIVFVEYGLRVGMAMTATQRNMSKWTRPLLSTDPSSSNGGREEASVLGSYASHCSGLSYVYDVTVFSVIGWGIRGQSFVGSGSLGVSQRQACGLLGRCPMIWLS